MKSYLAVNINRRLSIALCATLGLLMTGSAWAADKLVVRLDFSAWGLHGAMHLAQQKGWFEGVKNFFSEPANACSTSGHFPDLTSRT